MAVNELVRIVGYGLRQKAIENALPILPLLYHHESLTGWPVCSPQYSCTP